MRPLGVVIIGAGRRVQNNYLPALACLSGEFEIIGVHSRTKSKLDPVTEAWNVNSIYALSDVDFSNVDVIAVSVPPKENANVLKQLVDVASHIHLVIDTPIASTDEQYHAIYPLLKQFKHITVSEDYMNFPTFTFLRQIIGSGVIGKLKELYLFHIGYLYHGLALIRSFENFAPVQSSRLNESESASNNSLSYFFNSQMRATVIGPYRYHRSDSCGIVAKGEKGVITEFQEDIDSNKFGKNIFLLNPIRKSNKLQGYEITGKNGHYQSKFDDVIKMHDMNFADKSEMNLMRGQGLAEIFRSVAGKQNIHTQYTYKNAFYDLIASKLAATGAKNIDPLALFRQSDVWGLEGQEQGKKKINEVITFSVPFALEELQEAVYFRL
tara:strand:- start:238 stop:1380 length:1143 start_codon:yes stop_codon:yes gene_type:complete